MKIPTGAPEEQTADRAQNRISQIAVQRRHPPRSNSSEKSISHHELISIPQLIDEPVETAEIVAVVGITHDHVTAPCGTDAIEQRTP